MMTTSTPTVVVAMSGGVDSSVAAALLVERGYRVIGMMLRLWSEPGDPFLCGGHPGALS
jgi:tRNA-specific 2-thiouridylase